MGRNERALSRKKNSGATARAAKGRGGQEPILMGGRREEKGWEELGSLKKFP